MAHRLRQDRRLASFDPPGSTLTIPNFISPQGDIVGLYLDGSSVSHGFVLSGGNYTTVNFTGAPGSALTGLNPSGEMSGYYCSDPACGQTGNASTNQEHSFVVSKKGVFTSFDPPGATGSTASTVNPSGAIVGSYDTTAEGTCFNSCQGYLLYHGTFVTINFPAGIFTLVGGNNAPGDIVGEYVDTSDVGHSYLLSHGVYTSFDPPEPSSPLERPGSTLGESSWVSLLTPRALSTDISGRRKRAEIHTSTRHWNA